MSKKGCEAWKGYLLNRQLTTGDLNKEGSETVTNCHQLKMVAEDGDRP